MHRTLSCLCFLGLLCCAPALHAQGTVQNVAGKPIPTEMSHSISVYGQELLGQWTEARQGANYQPPRTKAYPGQRLIVALSAKGDDREVLLQDLTADFKITFEKTEQRLSSQRPALIRAVKAEGADFVNYALTSAGVSNPKELQSKLSMVSFALFDLGWTVPVDAKDGEVSISGSFQVKGKTTPLKASTISIASFESAVKTGDFKDMATLGEWSMTYYQHPEPPRLLNALRVIGKEQNAFAPNAMTFYAQAFKASPDAAKWVMGRLKGEENRGARLFGFLMLKEAGIDISKALAELSEEDQQSFAKVTGSGSMLPDPYDMTIREGDPYQLSSRLDMLWSIFIATGSAKPVRAIANTLMWRDDWKAFLKVKEDFQKTGKRPESMTPELLRASAYGAAGWSLGSFYRNHGLATDYIEAMKADPTVPEVVREELRNLIGNPAFKMEK